MKGQEKLQPLCLRQERLPSEVMLRLTSGPEVPLAGKSRAGPGRGHRGHGAQDKWKWCVPATSCSSVSLEHKARGEGRASHEVDQQLSEGPFVSV